MNYGLYMAASGVLTSMYRQDVMSNNLANIETVGYKPDVSATRERDPVRVEDNLLNYPSNRLLERLGAGVLLSPNRTAMVQGSLDRTDDPLNVAVKGEGFLVVSSGSGAGDERIRLTRDGRLSRRPDGRLVHAGSGAAVLDDADRLITLGPTPFTIGSDGTIQQDGTAIAKLQLSTVPDPSLLEKAGANLYKLSATNVASRKPATGEIAQGSLERSAVDPIQAIMGVTDAANATTANARMIQLFDDLMNRTINTYARVA